MMPPVTNIVGLSGSLRRASYNSALLRAAAAAMPTGATLTIASIAGVPVYNGDMEADGIPESVRALKDAIAGGDGLLLASPEYNNSVPGPLKNAIDWLSRPPADIARVFKNRPVAVMGASQGGFGTILGQSAWLPVFHTLGAHYWHGGRLMVSRAQTQFDDSGALTDGATQRALQAFVEGFVAFVNEQGARASQ